jgi:hypothetical protein
MRVQPYFQRQKIFYYEYSSGRCAFYKLFPLSKSFYLPRKTAEKKNRNLGFIAKNPVFIGMTRLSLFIIYVFIFVIAFMDEPKCAQPKFPQYNILSYTDAFKTEKAGGARFFLEISIRITSSGSFSL